MTVKLDVKGFREIEKALAKLPASTAKGVAKRAMRAELKPVASMANALWPGADDDVFKVGSKVKCGQPQPKRGRSIVNLHVGAVNKPEAHLIEWGTGPRKHESGKYVGAVAPHAMLGPAWDANRHGMLEGLGARLWDEIAKTMARRAAKGK
ncbi:hypothetical protein SAMN05216376_12077 [Mameliella alba]|uniref:hypothetical protein n=1 Tax=Mameliella alba TaxID=561184 RepID=UPI000882147D|nr:hypothetical protein [Mameliella alba]OWV41889.1 hypothetical protein CDZ96_24435 [Mameliella alba]PTR35550.1 hypothetical protein LX94_04736 [Mameliella alba]GGF82828.1 hypothetical protein GCM10011319_48590 [Mameliella alba]SDE20275.1 hypothetical protein SAMN05216376_12077 [Mameliella alba]